MSFTIDVHHHILPDFFWSATNDAHGPVGGFAALPLPDVDGALRELEYSLDMLRLDGAVLFSNARGVYLGDDRFTPLFDELERRSRAHEGDRNDRDRGCERFCSREPRRSPNGLWGHATRGAWRVWAAS
jgi:hypothetical protein